MSGFIELTFHGAPFGHFARKRRHELLAGLFIHGRKKHLPGNTHILPVPDDRDFLLVEADEDGKKALICCPSIYTAFYLWQKPSMYIVEWYYGPPTSVLRAEIQKQVPPPVLGPLLLVYQSPDDTPIPRT